MRKLFLFFTAMTLTTANICATIGDMFEVDHIQYCITSEDLLTVEVAQHTNYAYATAFVPAHVTHNSKEYTVTAFGCRAFYEGGGTHSSLEAIGIPNTVTELKEEAFYGCSQLKYIRIPGSVTTIGSSAFQKCVALSVIDIPASVTSIADNAFEGCTLLTDVIVSWTTIDAIPTIDFTVFMNIAGGTGLARPTSATLYVPTGTKDAIYSTLVVPDPVIQDITNKDKGYWKEFQIVEDDLAHYLRPITKGRFGTICYEHMPVSITGAKFYTVAGYDPERGLALDSVDVAYVYAGKPYIFLATATGDLDWAYRPIGRTFDLDNEHTNGLMGTYDDILTTTEKCHMLQNNAFVIALPGSGLAKFRAFLQLDEVPTIEEDNPVAQNPRKAGRMFVPMPAKTPTRLEETKVQGAMCNGKCIIKGRLYIRKDGKTYNAQGQMIQ